MKYPVLYASNATQFETLGIGVLSDALVCKVTEELNGQFELYMTYPADGNLLNEIQLRSLIKAKPSPNQDEQIFRVYDISSPISAIVTIRARHISYDLAGYIAEPFHEYGIIDTFANFPSHLYPSGCPFVFSTDKTITSVYELKIPSSARAVMGGMEGSFLDAFSGEYKYDGMNVMLMNHRGADRGFEVRYGRNMTDYTQEQNNENVYTHVYPYWTDAETGELVTLDDKVISTAGTYEYTRILPLDLSTEYQDKPNTYDLESAARRYIDANNIGVPDVSWNVSFVQLSRTEEYKDIALLERVDLGDTVAVVFPKYNVTASARVVKTEYDVLEEEYSNVELGRLKSSIADQIITIEKEVEKKTTKTIVEAITEALTSQIIGADGGSVRLLDTNGDGMPDTLYIADDPDPAQAQHVWRWNKNGWGASSDGYDGTYKLGATLESGLLAEFVTAAHLTAGTIASADGETFYLDLTNGILRMNGSAAIMIGDMTLKEALDNADASIRMFGDDLTGVTNYFFRDPETGYITIGDPNSPVSLVLKNNRLSFVQGAEELAYFANDRLTVEDITVGDTLDMGNWRITHSNGWSLRYIG